MAHIIILGKNRDFAKRIADANIELLDVHEALDTLPPAKREKIEELFAELEALTEAAKVDYAAKVDEILAQL